MVTIFKRIDAFFPHIENLQNFKKFFFINMNISLLDLERIHPPIHTPRTSVRFKIQASNAPQVSSFKNPFFGLELNFLKQIHDIESIHKPTSSRKKKVIFDILEDIANVDYGFKRHILYALNNLKPKEKDPDDIFALTNAKELNHLKKDLFEIQNRNKDQQKTVNKLKKIIEEKENRNRKMLDEIELMKDLLKNQNDFFSKSRKISAQLTNLQNEFNSMFHHRNGEEEETKIQKILKQNFKMKNEFIKLKYELDITRKITDALQVKETIA